mmetsp:Transcript_10715/g.27078  ORF Transcript_10715/g.27078 Transcript_10715/m.27078 type:complete len:271 (-) Transcript_10715:3021-3833(-)
MVGLRGVARRRANSLVLYLEHLVRTNVLVRCVPPQLLAHFGVQQLGEGLGEAVGDGLGHDDVVVVVLMLVLVTERLRAEAAGDRKGSDVVRDAGVLRRDEVGHGQVSVVLALLLLPERVELRHGGAACLIRVDLDIVAYGVGGVNADDCARLKQLVVDEMLHERQRVIVQLLRFLAHLVVVKDLGVTAVGVTAAQLPDCEEGVPVDVGDELRKRKVGVRRVSEHLGRGRDGLLPRDLERLGARLLDREELAIVERGVVLLAQLIVLLAHV